MHLLADLETIFQRGFEKTFGSWRWLFYFSLLVDYVAELVADQIHHDFQPKNQKTFLKHFSEDNNGSIILHIPLKEDHYVTLNCNYQRGRNLKISKIDFI